MNLTTKGFMTSELWVLAGLVLRDVLTGKQPMEIAAALPEHQEQVVELAKQLHEITGAGGADTLILLGVVYIAGRVIIKIVDRIWPGKTVNELIEKLEKK